MPASKNPNKYQKSWYQEQLEKTYGKFEAKKILKRSKAISIFTHSDIKKIRNYKPNEKTISSQGMASKSN